MNTEAERKFVRARTALLLDQPFFGTLALYLEMVQRPDIPTMRVDGKHIFYNPEFTMGLSSDLTKSAVCHEVMHCVLGHVHRCGGRDPNTWNRAIDYAANQLLKEAGFTLRDGWLQDDAFKDMSAEHIYDLLKEQDDKNGGGGSPGVGEPGGGMCDASSPAAESQSELEEAEHEWKVATIQAAKAASEAGNLPASFKRLVDDLTTTKVPWRDVLAQFVSQITKDDYSWARPNKRFLPYNIYMPSLYSERMGPIEVVIDTSGSIDDVTLRAFATEIQSIADSVRPERIRVTYCDAAIAHTDDYGPGETMKFAAHGGGGTDFRPPFERIAKEGEPPVALVYLTDLYGPAPAQAPDFPVLWCCINDQKGPWGQTVKLEL